VSVYGAIAGGAVGTLVLTTLLRGASETGLTRMDIPFLLGTAFTANRTRAKALGYGLHFVSGMGFALLYYLVFSAIHESGWGIGALFGLVHALFAGTVLVNVLLPLVHPRMATPLTAAPEVALLETPGFMLRNYGIRTPLVTLAAHLAFGAIVGGFASLG
jgi:hypothetical protein